MKKVWLKITLLFTGLSLLLSVTMGALLIYSNNSLKSGTLTTINDILRDGFDRSITWEVETAKSIIESIDQLVSDGTISVNQGDIVAKHVLREARFGESGYFWADDSNGKNIVLLGNDSEGKNRFELKDVKGNFLIKDIIKNGKKSGGGFTDYWFPKAGSDSASPKRSYSLYYSKRDWIIGTGNYTDDIDTEVQSHKNVIDVKIKKIGFLSLMILTIMFIIIVTCSVFLGILLTKSIKDTSEALKEISLGGGDLTKSIEIRTKDEIGILAKSFNKFVSKLREIISAIKVSLESTKINSEDLKVTSSETSSAVIEISANSESIEKQVAVLNSNVDDSINSINKIIKNIEILDGQVESQATAVEQSSASVVEMVASINSVANKSKDKIDTVHKMIEITRNGRIELQATKNRVSELTDSVNEILKVTGMINDIASRSSLLSMNASIEAAHAGEAGKGFGVVAGEIRKLSESSETYANSINQTLKGNIESIENLRVSVDSSLAIFEDVENSAIDTENAFSEITNTMSELSSGTEEINRAVSSLQEITSMVSDSTKEMNGSVLQIRTSSVNLKDISSVVVEAISEINQGLLHIGEVMEGLNNSVRIISDDIDNINNQVDAFIV